MGVFLEGECFLFVLLCIYSTSVYETFLVENWARYVFLQWILNNTLFIHVIIIKRKFLRLVLYARATGYIKIELYFVIYS